MPVTINGTTGVIGPDGSASTPSYQGSDNNTGIFFPAADTIAFAEGGAEVARFNSSGNLGIGTSSPTQRLHVFSSVAEVATLEANFNSTDNVQLRFKGFSGERWAIGNNVATGGTGVNFDFYDLVASANRVRIDSSGNLLVGTTNAISSSRLAVVGDVADHLIRIRNDNGSTPAGVDVNYNATAPNNTGSTFFQGRDNAAVRFTVRSNGGIANFSGNDVNLSDRREKTNFAPAGEYLSKICAIPVQTFNYADQNLEEDPGLTLGVVAQDVQAVAPELVMESNWGTAEEPKMRLSIYQTDLQYALMKCIQEQQALIAALQADVAALKGAQA